MYWGSDSPETDWSLRSTGNWGSYDKKGKKKKSESVELASWLENLLSLEEFLKSRPLLSLSLCPCVICKGKRVYELNKWTSMILCVCLRQPYSISWFGKQISDFFFFFFPCILLFQLLNGITAVIISWHIHLGSMALLSKLRIRGLFQEKQTQSTIRN